MTDRHGLQIKLSVKNQFAFISSVFYVAPEVLFRTREHIAKPLLSVPSVFSAVDSETTRPPFTGLGEPGDELIIDNGVNVS